MFEKILKGAVKNAFKNTGLSQEDAKKYKILDIAIADSGLDLKKSK